jgi:hypothetical protein
MGMGMGSAATGGQHDDGSGDGVSGERPAGDRDTGGELAIVYDGERSAGGGRHSTTVTIAPDGFVSVNLAPNQGATPAGLYYTAVYYLSDGTTNTQYWVVPAAAQATLGQVQAQLMPAAQAVQAVSKAYVDQAIAALAGSLLTASGGTLTGPLTCAAIRRSRCRRRTSTMWMRNLRRAGR